MPCAKPSPLIGRRIQPPQGVRRQYSPGGTKSKDPVVLAFTARHAAAARAVYHALQGIALRRKLSAGDRLTSEQVYRHGFPSFRGALQ